MVKVICLPCREGCHPECDQDSCSCATCSAWGWLVEVTARVKWDESHGFTPKRPG